MNFLTELREGLGISWGAIRANKMRSLLATLGIVIGIVTVTLMATAIAGLNRAFLNSISAIGGDVLYVQRFNWFAFERGAWEKMVKRPQITVNQAMALEENLKLARAVAPTVYNGRSVKYKNKSSRGVAIIGTTEQFPFTSAIAVEDGRFLSSTEVELGRAACVLGQQVATNLFGRASPVGSIVRIGGQAFEVVGVMERQGNFLGRFSLDNQVIVPLKQFLSSFWNTPDVQIQIKVADLNHMEDAKDEVRSAMRKIRRLAPKDADDFGINEQSMFINLFHQIAGTIAAVGLFITGLSLFVGGIGIMNIMFVSVAERTREIGIRKAIGAKRRTILLQFLIEAATICLIGGCVALAIAWPLTLLMSKFLPATLSPTIVGLALGVSALTGIASGFLPAWRAARMNPVDALRAE